MQVNAGVIRKIMKSSFKDLLINFAKRMPFHGYIERLYLFIKAPHITNQYGMRLLCEHSLSDILNSLGLSATIIAFIALLDPSYSYLKVLLVINPVYLVLSCLIYAVTISFTMSLSIGIVALSPASENKQKATSIYFHVFCHSLRSYAAIALFISLPFTYSMGIMITTGVPYDQAFKGSWPWGIYIISTLVVLPAWILFKPLNDYLNIKIIKPIGYLIVLFSLYVSFNINHLLPIDFSGLILNKQELCKVYKSGDFYKELNNDDKLKSEEYFCK